MGTLPNSSNHPCFRSDRLGSYICGQYCDRGNTLSCKKAVSRGSTLTDAVCILRLKRRLIAGCSDADWPIHRQRSHHVGKGLQDFAEAGLCRGYVGSGDGCTGGVMALTRMSGCCAWNRGLPLARAYLDTVLMAYTRLFPWCTCAHTVAHRMLSKY